MSTILEKSMFINKQPRRILGIILEKKKFLGYNFRKGYYESKKRNWKN